MSSQINSLDDLTANTGEMWAVLNGTDYRTDISSIGHLRSGEPVVTTIVQNAQSHTQSGFLHVNGTAIYNPWGICDTASRQAYFIKSNMFTRLVFRATTYNLTGRRLEVLVNSERVGAGLILPDGSNLSFAHRGHMSSMPFSVSSGDQVGIINLDSAYSTSAVDESFLQLVVE